MTPERWDELDRVWHALLERPEPERASAIDELCAEDQTLRRDIESLLAHLVLASAAGFGAAAVVVADARESLIGCQLGSYAVHTRLGAGGMGEVFQATDSTLAREVAIKILPDLWLADPDRQSRFDREARLLASLNHPNIGSIYGVHDSGSSTRALILELVQGETLANVTPSLASVHSTWAALPLRCCPRSNPSQPPASSTSSGTPLATAPTTVSTTPSRTTCLRAASSGTASSSSSSHVRLRLRGTCRRRSGLACASREFLFHRSRRPCVLTTSTEMRTPGSVLGSVTFVIAATGAFLELQSALNTIWRVKPKLDGHLRAFLIDRLRSFGLVVAIGFLLMVSLTVTAALSALSGWLTGPSSSVPLVWRAVNMGASVAVTTVLFALLTASCPTCVCTGAM